MYYSIVTKMNISKCYITLKDSRFRIVPSQPYKFDKFSRTCCSNNLLRQVICKRKYDITNSALSFQCFFSACNEKARNYRFTLKISSMLTIMERAFFHSNLLLFKGKNTKSLQIGDLPTRVFFHISTSRLQVEKRWFLPPKAQSIVS